MVKPVHGAFDQTVFLGTEEKECWNMIAGLDPKLVNVL